jgi:hypothetical protein
MAQILHNQDYTVQAVQTALTPTKSSSVVLGDLADGALQQQATYDRQPWLNDCDQLTTTVLFNELMTHLHNHNMAETIKQEKDLATRYSSTSHLNSACQEQHSSAQHDNVQLVQRKQASIQLDRYIHITALAH